MVNAVKQSWITFKSIFTGMGVTFRHLFGPSVTLQYPDEKMELPEGARAKLYVNIDDCIGCNLCARACPVNCIDIETVAATSDVDLGKTSTGNPKRFWLTRFNIDMAKCMYCDLCVYPCPTECIYMVPEYEYSEFDRSNLVYHFSNLLPEMVAEVKEKAAIEAEEKKRQREEMMKKKNEAVKMKKEMEAQKNAGTKKSGDDKNGEKPSKAENED
jgi:NADH-quinone oxidoreductase subunit I